MKKLKKLILVMLSVAILGLVGCGQEESKGFVIDDKTNLEILNVESQMEGNKHLAKITYKITGKNENNDNSTYLHILTEEKYNKIINGEIEKLDRLEDAPKPHGDTITNEDGSKTVYLNTYFNKVQKYKAIIIFNAFQDNEKTIVADLNITEEIADKFKASKDIVDDKNQEIKDKNEEIKKQHEEAKKEEPKKYKESVIGKMAQIGQDVIDVSNAYNSGDFEAHAEALNSLIKNCKSLKGLDPTTPELKDIDLTVEIACDLYLESAQYMSKAVLEMDTDLFKTAEEKSKEAGEYFSTVISKLDSIK